MALAEIASLWIGPRLSWLEQLCLKSFVDAGHRVTLFSYDKVEGVPDGVHTEDANTFLPATEFVRHARTGSPAYHADVFRLRMIRDSNLTWVDTDAYCVKPFTIARHGHLHGWISDNVPQINNGVLKLPKKSKTLKAMLDFTADEYPIPPWFSDEKQAQLRDLKEAGRGVHVSLLPWGVWGPNALTHFLHETGEVKYSQPGPVLYPIPFSHKRSLLKPGRRHLAEGWVTDDTMSIHFWGRRFRSAVSESGGVPVEGSYTLDLLRKHNIDPAPTAHMMQPVAARVPLDVATYAQIDFSMLDEQDIVNLAMQRSSGLDDQAATRGWVDGDESLLRAEARDNREQILRVAFDELRADFERIAPEVRRLSPRRVADIGSGYAFVDLLMHRAFDCDVVLIDIEDSDERHFGFEDSGAGYSSLKKAREFLKANGVPDERIITINPRTDDLGAAGEVDLAMSLISCGFHYPAQTYDKFFHNQVAPTGGIVLDVRKGSGGIPYLKGFGRTKILHKDRKHASVFVQKRVD